MLLHAVEEAGELIEVAGIDIEVEHVAVAIEELVGGPAVDVQMTLNGGLLFVGQVVVRHVRTADVIFLDDVLP